MAKPKARSLKPGKKRLKKNPPDAYLQVLSTEHVPVGVAIFQGPEFVTTFANPLICRMWGKSHGEVIDKPFFDAIPEIRNQGFEELLSGVMATGIPYVGNELPVIFERDEKKETVYFNFVYNPVRDKQGVATGVMVIASEVTSKVEMIKQIAEERRHLHELFEQAPAAIAIFRGPEHVHELANPLYLMQLGDRARNVIGKTIREVFPELEGQGVYELFDQVYRTGKPFIGNELFVKLDRKGNGALEDAYFNFVYQPSRDRQGKVDGILAHAVEVTDQVVSRKKAEESEERYHNLFVSIDEGFCIIEMIFDEHERPVDYRFLEVNPAFESQSGLRDVVGKRMKELRPEHEAYWFERYGKVALDGEPVRFQAKSDALEGRSFNVYALRVGDPRERRVAVVFNDISNQVQTNIKLEAASRQKDEFIGMASHELKTPVTSIKAYAQILESRFKKSKDTQSAELVGKMDGQIGRLTNLIADLLDITKIESGRLQFQEGYFDFNGLVEEVVEEMQRTTERHVIEMELVAIKEIYGDRDRVGQVISNFLSNALKYSPHGKRIYVKTTMDSNNVTLSVQDFGIGLSAENVARVFERFYRVAGSGENTYPGLGLGLYISSEIIERQNGSIWAESQLGKGSTFSFSLPMRKTKILQQKNTLVEQEIKHD